MRRCSIPRFRTRAPRLLDGLARRRGAAVAVARRAQVVNDIDPGVEVPKGHARAPSEADAERRDRAEGSANLGTDLDVDRAKSVGLRGKSEDGGDEARSSEKARNTHRARVSHAQSGPRVVTYRPADRHVTGTKRAARLDPQMGPRPPTRASSLEAITRNRGASSS